MNAQGKLTMRAAVVDISDPRRLVLKEVPRPESAATEMLVKVQAISLNRGETRMALKEATDGWRPGWDVAGVVERPAADGPAAAGTRVVCTTAAAGWAEYITVAPPSAATIPDAVSFEQAASLPGRLQPNTVSTGPTPSTCCSSIVSTNRCRGYAH